MDGGPYFSTLLRTISAAQSYVYLESYIICADQAGQRVADALVERAEQGIEVAVMYDGFGSLTLDGDWVRRLRAAGAHVFAYRPVSPWRGRWPWSRRNHRKLLVVDGAVGIVGGQNISDDYAAPEDGGDDWRDTAVRIEGPAVTQLDVMFRELWAREGGPRLEAVPGYPPDFGEGPSVRFLANRGIRTRAEIRRAYLRAILSARASVCITTAYFSPDRVLLRALRRAARRGVRVELITAGATDVEPVRYAARGLYSVLMKDGVRIYEWHERVLHAKTAVVDGTWSTIGSANFNHRTWLKDLEVNATIVGEAIGRLMDAQFDADREKSQRIDLAVWKKRPFTQRLVEWFFGLFRRMI